MNYSEFRNTYKWMLSKYPGTNSIYRDDMDEIIGTLETVNYEKRGGKWKETERKTESFTRRNYANGIDAVPWFRNFGGRERVELAYTRIAFLPVKVSSISPDGTSKTVRNYYFK